MRILELPKQFRPSTSIIYPPFKNGKYMEEYFYDFLTRNSFSIDSDKVYIPIFWTNLQNHPGFQNMKHSLTIILNDAIKKLPNTTKFFTVVQHDDGPLLKLPSNTIIFGACTGTVPLPLIYEDKEEKLSRILKESDIKKEYLASFVGTNTHKVRDKLEDIVRYKTDIFYGTQKSWTNSVSKSAADLFVQKTLASKFCLAPRGYGRSSFRFFEAMILNVIPVYFWDDIEWLPYKEFLDYSDFAVSIQLSDIHNTEFRLKLISDEVYLNMASSMQAVKKWFTLEGMSRYILWKLEENYDISPWDIEITRSTK
jgi:hypothetical protein